MKKLSLIIISILFNIYSYAQSIQVDLNNSSIDGCEIYDLVVNGDTLNELGNCVFDFPQLVSGQTYELELVTRPNVSSGINLSLFDLILLTQILRGTIDDKPVSTYLSDIDHDGAVSTYDLLNLRAILLSEYSPLLRLHVVKANMEIPEIDPYDIQVDYSKLLFTSEDFDNGVLQIRNLQLGNVDDE